MPPAVERGCGERPASSSVGIDEDGDQIITLLICVHQIFEINGSRSCRRSPTDNFVWAGPTRHVGGRDVTAPADEIKCRAIDRRFLTGDNRHRRRCQHQQPLSVTSCQLTHHSRRRSRLSRCHNIITNQVSLTLTISENNSCHKNVGQTRIYVSSEDRLAKVTI